MLTTVSLKILPLALLFLWILNYYLEKFKMLGLRFSLLNWIGPFTLNLLLKLLPRKLEHWLILLSLFFLKLLLSLKIYHLRLHGIPCHFWAGAPNCYLDKLDKLKKQIFRTVGPSLATSLEPLAHHRDVTSWSFFYRCYFGNCSTYFEILSCKIISFNLWSIKWLQVKSYEKQFLFPFFLNSLSACF